MNKNLNIYFMYIKSNIHLIEDVDKSSAILLKLQTKRIITKSQLNNIVIIFSAFQISN